MEEALPTLKSGFYKHFKGDQYLVIGVAEQTETHEALVVYVAQSGIYAGLLRCRPLAMFIEQVERSEYSYTGPRFALVRECNVLEGRIRDLLATN